jgi:succinyl-CoA synthetase beta subunit
MAALRQIFLDIGGSFEPSKSIDAMTILLSDSNVKAVMINFFGGITRCDDVARGLISALNVIKTDIRVGCPPFREPMPKRALLF